MRKQEKETAKTQQPERVTIPDNTQISIKNVRAWDNGGITFDLTLNQSINLYGLKVVEGKNGDFISFPARQGKDGKWYNYYYVNLSELLQSMILAEVERQLNG